MAPGKETGVDPWLKAILMQTAFISPRQLNATADTRPMKGLWLFPARTGDGKSLKFWTAGMKGRWALTDRLSIISRSGPERALFLFSGMQGNQIRGRFGAWIV
jgi:hypothetical protein